MNPSNIPDWVIFLGALFVILVSGRLGELDYRDQRNDQCAQQDKDYNAEADLCVKRIRSK